MTYATMLTYFSHNFVSIIVIITCFTQFTEYIQTLLDLLFFHVIHDPSPYQALLASVAEPAPLSSQYEHPEKSAAIAEYRSRFCDQPNLDEGE